MIRRSLAVAGVLAIVAAATITAHAQNAEDVQWAIDIAQPPANYRAPRTPWGDPDIAGAFTRADWTSFERNASLGDKEFYTPEEYAAEIERRRGQPVETITEEDRNRGNSSDVHYDFAQYGLVAGQNEFSPNLRTSVVVDPPNGRLPETVGGGGGGRGGRGGRGGGGGAVAFNDGGPETRSLSERCILWTSTLTPILPGGGYNSNVHIFQSPGYVVIQAEMGDARVIPTDGREINDDIPQWNGSSVGHWEGDTLVVETTNFREESNFRGAQPHRVITERISRISDEQVEYRFTVNDPETWVQPWTGVYPLTEIEGPLYEYACHEGNYGLGNILAGLRAEEAAEAAAASGQ